MKKDFSVTTSSDVISFVETRGNRQDISRLYFTKLSKKQKLEWGLTLIRVGEWLTRQ